MTTPNTFKKGDFLFRQGDACDHVFHVRHGAIEILKEVGTSSILLGQVSDGEWLGEMAVIENRSHSATARAAIDSEVEVLTAQQFLQQVSHDPTMAHDLILRLSIRLREIENKVAGDMFRLMHDAFPDRAPETASDAMIPVDSTISISAESEILRGRIGTEPIRVYKSPFLVGRALAKGEPRPSQYPDFQIADHEPFRLSREHFKIMRSSGRVFISDTTSTLGTVVNGQAIGHHFMRDTAPLHRGDNHVVAGGRDSPFQFVVSIQSPE